MEQRDPVEILATYLRKTARAGGGVSSNRKALAMHLHLSVEQVCEARDALHTSGRLKMSRYKAVYTSIDGIAFGGAGMLEPKTGALMNYLRRQFDPVYDARVAEQPNAIPRGEPQQVVIGSVKTHIGFAVALVLCQPGSRLLTA